MATGTTTETEELDEPEFEVSETGAAIARLIVGTTKTVLVVRLMT